jgi:hypothetical protein
LAALIQGKHAWSSTVQPASGGVGVVQIDKGESPS